MYSNSYNTNPLLLFYIYNLVNKTNIKWIDLILKVKKGLTVNKKLEMLSMYVCYIMYLMLGNAGIQNFFFFFGEFLLVLRGYLFCKSV